MWLMGIGGQSGVDRLIPMLIRKNRVDSTEFQPGAYGTKGIALDSVVLSLFEISQGKSRDYAIHR